MHRWWLISSVLLSLPANARATETVVLVFDIEDKGSGLGADALDRMTEYLNDRIAAAGSYRVVPRSQLKEKLGTAKSESFKSCYDESCQIEIGKELAAQQTLSARIIKLGSRCTVSSSIYDLRSAASVRAATANGACDEDAIVGALDRVIEELTGAQKAAATTVKEVSKPVAAAPAADRPLVEPQRDVRTEWLAFDPGLMITVFFGEATFDELDGQHRYTGDPEPNLLLKLRIATLELSGLRWTLVEGGVALSPEGGTGVYALTKLAYPVSIAGDLSLRPGVGAGFGYLTNSFYTYTGMFAGSAVTAEMSGVLAGPTLELVYQGSGSFHFGAAVNALAIISLANDVGSAGSRVDSSLDGGMAINLSLSVGYSP